jgi:UTP-glucose-1-phosphate uridylyltransferase
MNIFVPGRICLFGEHSDWAGGYRRLNAEVEKGYTLICGTNQGIHAEVEPHPTALVLTSTTSDGETRGPCEIPLEPRALLEEAQGGGFFSYAAGVAYQVLTNYRVRGLRIRNFRTNLPIKKGLSSSAAICVLTARAFNRVYDLRLTVRGEKELFPVVDRDGIAKPAILLIVEEALEAGIEEVVIVVQEQDLADFRSFFGEQISIENYNKLPRHFQDYARRILDIGRRITFVTQTAQEGFGHAVFCARASLAGEPFLLMLGDHLYRSATEVSCARQLVEAYQRTGTSVVGLRRTPEAEIAAFGAATGVWLEPDRLLNVTEFAEKPTVDYARTSLRVPGLPDGEYLTVFGQYVIKPQLFEYLEEHIRNNVRERGEFQLTSALDRLRQEDGFHGLIVDGRRFDIGLPEHYLETLRTFREP